MAGKIPIYIIIIVIILILIFVVVIASYEDNSDKVKNKRLEIKKVENNPWGINSNTKNTTVQKINTSKELDASIFEFDSNTLNYKESFIFGGHMQYSSVSIYKNEVLVYNKVFSGNCGLVISNNLQNVNASFFQIGKRINLENTKYEYIPITFNDENVKVAINNVDSVEFKVFKCIFDYDIIPGKSLDLSLKSTKDSNNLFSISEYDLVKQISETSGLNLSRVYPQRSFDKNQNWFMNQSGSYVVYYIKGLYSFDIINLKDNSVIHQNNKKSNITVRDLNALLSKLELDHFYIEDPNISIINKDENIPKKNLNSDVIKLFNTPMELYNHFIYGKKKIPIDIWNKINNKIFIFKIL
jgi:hypothetical protein